MATPVDKATGSGPKEVVKVGTLPGKDDTTTLACKIVTAEEICKSVEEHE